MDETFMDETRDRVKVLYICGTRRCGSTMLSRLLGAVDGFVNVGEMASYFLRQKLAGPCGCGAPVDGCPFWKGFPVSPAVQALGRDLIRIRRLPRLLIGSHEPSRNMRKLLDYANRLYREIRDKTGAAVIVDSSKSPAMAHVLGQCEALAVSVVHLTRDPAGVVGSRRGPKGYLQSESAPRTLVEWWAYNLAAESLARRSARYWRIRCEDVVRSPRTWVEGISSAVAGQPKDGCFIVGNRAQVGTQHILGGNPDKLTGSDILIHDHDSELPAWIAAPVYLLASPLLLHYRLTSRTKGLGSKDRLRRRSGASPAIEL